MVALTKFFGKKNGNPDPAVATAEAAPEDASQTPLESLVRASQSEERRERQAALAELARRLDAGAAELAELREAGLGRHDALALQLHRGEAPDADEADWQAVALGGFSAAVRNRAAERIDSQPCLDALARAAKGHDKAVYRIARDKLDRLREAQYRVEAEQGRAHTVVEAMERHAQASLDPLYAGKLKAVLEQWHECEAGADAALRERFEAARARAEQRLEVRDEADQAEAEEHRALAMADDNRQAIAERVLEELRERSDALDLDDEAVREAQHFLTEQQHLWRESEQLSRPDKAEERAFHRLCTAFETALTQQARLVSRFGPLDELLARLENSPEQMDAEAHALDQWLHDLDWPDDRPAPALKARVEQALARHHDQLAEHRKQEIQQVRQARGLMRRCMAAVNDGHLRRASGLLHGIQDALEGLGEAGHPGLYRQYEDTRAAVERLRDWQSFAVQPKKEALIERMAALIDQSMEPQERARTIRAMQDEWRMLSRGLQNQHQDLWERFHALAQQAYEPCREYFNEQSKLRALNLEKRRELVDQLTQYEALTEKDEPDIKEIDRVLNMARQDWRRLAPVDRAANKPVQKAFDAVLKRLRGRLQQEQSEYRQAKEAIIERARALLDEEDMRKATEAAKALQQEWQRAGHLARRDEQTLWKEFRAVCDQLFERRGQQVEAFKADLEAHRQQAEALIVELEALAEAEEPASGQSRADELREQFRNLGTLPKAHHKALLDRFAQAGRQFDAACRSQRHQRRDRHWQALIDWVRRARFDDRSSTDELVDAFAALEVPAPASDLEARLNDWRGPASDEAREALRRRTIELEALTGLDSPEADRGVRMELQVQRLAEGLGQTVNQADIDRAVVDWLASGAVAEADYDALEARMKAARQAWLGSPSRKN